MDYKCKDGMIDNRMVKDNHQQGIERVKQRGVDRMDVAGHNGKMGKGHREGNFARKDNGMTPKKA